MEFRKHRVSGYWHGIGISLTIAASSASPAWSQGSAVDIVIGQSGAISGPTVEIGKEMKAGAEAYFNVVNQAGGVNGRKIRLVALDDGGEPDRTKANTQKLIAEDNAVALFGYGGEHTIKSILPMVDKAKIPFVAAASGDQNLRDPFNRYIFNIRASYFEETERGIDQYVRRGMNKIALFYQNDPYGRAGLAGVDKAMRDRKLGILIFGSVDRNSTNTTSAAQSINKAGAQAVVIAAGARTAAAFIKEMKKLGSNAQYFVLSASGAKALASELGDDGRGVAVSQVVPLPTAEGEPLGREYVKHIGGVGNATFASLEGYIGARVLVEGLKKAGKVPTRESLTDALERLGLIDLAGFKVKFMPGNHNGSSLVELTVIGAQGLYRR
jgi:ABC-type branched-subunit amino acid transport system substrate-binding protein